MGKHLRNAINILMEMLMSLSGKVERNVSMAFEALESMDSRIAKEVIKRDDEIDKDEILIEEECLKILALHQPVATDLRYIITALKVNNDLERIGDLSQDIAGHILNLINFPNYRNKINFQSMYNTVLYMLKNSINSMINIDEDLALDVIKKDDIVDNDNKKISLHMVELLKNDSKNAEFYLQNIYISRRLERIADLATNIAQDTIYLASGKIVRHYNENNWN
jgi:phosphate transport system protein